MSFKWKKKKNQSFSKTLSQRQAHSEPTGGDTTYNLQKDALENSWGAAVLTRRVEQASPDWTSLIKLVEIHTIYTKKATHLPFIVTTVFLLHKQTANTGAEQDFFSSFHLPYYVSNWPPSMPQNVYFLIEKSKNC